MSRIFLLFFFSIPLFQLNFCGENNQDPRNEKDYCAAQVNYLFLLLKYRIFDLETQRLVQCLSLKGDFYPALKKDISLILHDKNKQGETLSTCAKHNKAPDTLIEQLTNLLTKSENFFGGKHNE